jgi:Flp pilus assembly pilin Flp
MLKNFLKNKKAQNTAEYALLIALVVAGVIAMQTYAQRSLQARMRDAGHYLQQTTNKVGNTEQYEPYYLHSDYTINRESTENTRLGVGLIAKDATTNRTRSAQGYQASEYTEVANRLINGI